MTDAQQPADPERPACPEYHPGSARPELNRPVRERYPQIRSTSGYGDPRVRRTGPGPGAGTDQEPERSSKLTARLALAMTVVIGQLRGLTVVVDEWRATPERPGGVRASSVCRSSSSWGSGCSTRRIADRRRTLVV